MTLPQTLNPNLENGMIGAICTEGGYMPAYASGLSVTRNGTLACWLKNPTTTDGLIIFQNKLRPNSTPELTFLPAKTWIPIKFTHLLESATVDGTLRTSAFSDPTVLLWGASGE